jgi:cytosine/adenosine deaminase-related metal-dependent hydrolase
LAADFAGVRLDSLALAGGAVHDPLAAIVFCRPPNVDFTIVNGVPLVEHGAFTALDIERVVAKHNELARALVSR